MSNPTQKRWSLANLNVAGALQFQQRIVREFIQLQRAKALRSRWTGEAHRAALSRFKAAHHLAAMDHGVPYDKNR